MYELLATAGSRCPSLDTNLPNLPWQCIWSGRGTEILRLEHRKAGNCFALRSRIIEDQLEHTLRETKALLHPRMHVQPKRQFGIAAAGVLAALVLIVGAVVGYRQIRKMEVIEPMVVSARVVTQEAVTPLTSTNYYLLVNRERSGPFPLGIILAREAAGELPDDALIRAEQSEDWLTLDTLTGSESK